MQNILPLLGLMFFVGVGCTNTPVTSPQTISPTHLFPNPTSHLPSPTLTDFIRERKTFPSFLEVEGRARPAELETMNGRNFVYVNNCPDKKPTPSCQYRITLFADDTKDASVFFLQESQAGKPTIYYGPITGSVSTLVGAMNKVVGKTIYDVP